ncbi:hypothetical protein TELCIR_15914 [Teladorsagia circumcincta]|uniref:Uncharacterized protein n=1 Tax=Teladorsagia circumcincta TaxID=45464 RepID=A0A2G9TX69_TELCI|nr:hypothetical protein TELCIR_15914 [Teladorsagia circumcincta]
MSAGGSQPAKKKRKTIVIDLEEESDDDVQFIEEKRSSSQPSYEELNPQDNPDAFYSQRQHPKFHTRNLERAVQKQRKSTAVDVVAKSLRLEVLKWERSGNLEVVNYGGDCYLKEESELNSLLSFLRSSTLPIKNKNRRSEKPRRRLYHIDDLPTLAYQDVSEFRRLIYPFLLNTRHIVVFDLTTRDSSWHMSPKRVFSTQFISVSANFFKKRNPLICILKDGFNARSIQSLNICELNFYPIANTFMRKGLRRAVDVLGFHSRLSIQDYRAVEKLANDLQFSYFTCLVHCYMRNDKAKQNIPT